jgi:hypothetical protein
MFTITIGNFNTQIIGLQPITQSVSTLFTLQQETSYRGEVHIDPNSGLSGTSYPNGTASDPVDNIVDALDIAVERGLHRIVFLGQHTLDRDLNGYAFIGQSVAAKITVGNNNITGCVFERSNLTGDMITSNTEGIHTFDCHLEDLHGFHGAAHGSILRGTITLKQDVESSFFDCSSGVPGSNTPAVSMSLANSDSTAVQVRAYSGGIKIENVQSANNDVSIDTISAHVILANNVTDGTISVRGVGKLTDNSANTANIDRDGFVDHRDIRLIKQVTAGKAVVSPDDQTITIYEEDDTTVLATYNVSVDTRTRTRTS